MYDIIAKKRDGNELTEDEIQFFINGYVRDEVPDYQAAAWCMAVYLKGMTARETAALTQAMVNSGETMDLSLIPGIKVDKHSTGGVGDTTTLRLAPLVAAMGVPVAKMSGRGLGHTGGTLDKLESIPGFRCDLSRDVFNRQVQTIGLAVAGQTGNLVPADKKLYALRDVTATVESIPLIASSVMSKKLAAGADAILLDVKVGAGAFMKTPEEALILARTMVEIGTNLRRKTAALLTNMEQPLGNAIGNALEVSEAIAILRGESDLGLGGVSQDLRQVTVKLAARMAWMAGRALSVADGMVMAERVLASGQALERFQQLVVAQGGDGRIIEDPWGFLIQAKHREPILASGSGFVYRLDALALGQAAAALGAGRERKEDMIDPSVGVVMHKRVGDQVKAGETLAEIHYNTYSGKERALELIANAYSIGEKDNCPFMPLIIGEVKPE